MLGGMGMAEIRIFLALVWATAFSAVAALLFHKLHFKMAFRIAASLGLVSLALALWAYFSIWGFVWFQ